MKRKNERTITQTPLNEGRYERRGRKKSEPVDQLEGDALRY